MDKAYIKQLEKDLWAAADNLRANSGLKSSEYATPVLGLIFLKFADNNYRKYEAEIVAEYEKLKGTRREKKISEIAIAKCGFYLPDEARYDYLLNLPGDRDIAQALKVAMAAIEQHKPELDGVLPKDEYFKLIADDPTLPNQLLKTFADIPQETTGDLFGKIYEYFLGKFALAEGQGGGEFFTPQSVVKLMVEVIEPHGGTVYDPACGSGGMFVQSAQFIERHRAELGADVDTSVYVYGQEKTAETVKLAKMNLAVNGLRGEISSQNTYYNDPYDSFGKFDYVLANPPFNVDDVSLSAVEGDRRFNTFGIPRNKTKVKKADEGKETVPNANYLWINLFATSLSDRGRAALVMANSASDARHSEAEIRERLIRENLIYGMLTLPSNLFYTVTLPATLWFFDRAKSDDRVLFIDARNIFTQIDRAHREFSDEQVQNIAVISRLHRGDRAAFVRLVDGYFAAGMARLEENQAQVGDVAAQLGAVLDDQAGRDAVDELKGAWAGWQELRVAYGDYEKRYGKRAGVDRQNEVQRELAAVCEPFFGALHGGLKRLDRVVREHEKELAEAAKAAGKRSAIDREVKLLKQGLGALHDEVRGAEVFFRHVHWLQERFPAARYEDVTGLCKLATVAEIAEQDFSLNPGRYVGVVIEEDGKTEEEFIEEILGLNEELGRLNQEAQTLELLIENNISQIAGE